MSAFLFTIAGLLLVLLYKKVRRVASLHISILAMFFMAGMAYVAYPTSNEKQQGEKREPIHFLQTNPEINHLTDTGSWVGTNKVHLAYSVRLLPQSAMLYLDYISKEEPPESNNYTTYLAGTVDATPNIIEFEFENPQNYRWVFYTTYVQAPSVHTNGVAVAEFLKPKKYDNIVVPKRSSIWENSKMIYPAQEKLNLLEALGEDQ